jgi:hypothetical protein
MAEFYEKFFAFKALTLPGDRIVELVSSNKSGSSIMLHPAAKSVKTGQVTVKLVFDVKDVEEFKAACRIKGLKFGSVHNTNGYSFANSKDPDKNSIQISSRKFLSKTVKSKSKKTY